MVQWISDDNKDSIYVGINGVNDGNYGYNNIQELPIATWTHKFDETFWTITEGWYMFERNVPPEVKYTWECAVVNYFEARLSDNAYLSIRNEYFNDHNGQRTGHKTQYSEHTLGITYWFNRVITFRPEFRYDQAYNNKAYDQGTKFNQYVLAADVIFHY